MNLKELLPRPSPESVNTGLNSCPPSLLREKFGDPRLSYSQDCKPPTGRTLKANLATGKWFGQKVTGLKWAVESLARIEETIREHHPELVPHMGHQGMICCRYQRGSNSKVSNHAWGNAIDLVFDGEVDRRGDNKCQKWLLIVYPYFHTEGWYWGSEFKTEDSMHFELAEETVRKIKVLTPA